MDQSATIDPAQQPSAYRDLVLGLLGDDDPAEVQAATATALRTVVEQAGELLRTKPAPHEWSVLELVGHMADAGDQLGVRYRLMLSEDVPAITAFDQDHWVDGLRHGDGEAAELLDGFDGLRRANLALWRRTSEEGRARYGIHQERGPESFDLLFRMMAGHDRFHLDQIASTLEQVGQG